MPLRPSKNEIYKKVADALAAIEAGRRMVVAMEKHLADDMAELDIDDDELWNVLSVLLKEVQTSDPDKCYAGTRPPQKAYEPEIEDEELWAYAWPSCHFGRGMYVKFAMKRNAKGEWVFWHVRLHEDKP